MSDEPYKSPRQRTPVKRNRPSTGFVIRMVLAVFVFLGLVVYRMSNPVVRMNNIVPPKPAESVEPTPENSEPEAPSEAAAEPLSNTFTAKVIGIVYGDTIDLLNDAKKTIRLRLNGIDCPETGQPFGRNAKEFTSDRVGGEMVKVVIVGEPDRPTLCATEVRPSDGVHSA